MTKRIKSDGSAAPDRPRGSFDPEGSWKSGFEYPGATERYVAILVRARLASRLSPAEIAAQIRAASTIAFPSAALGEWDALAAWEDWPFTPARSGAEEAVKRCGRGHDGHWEGGTWVAGRDDRNLPEMDLEGFGELLPTLSDVPLRMGFSTPRLAPADEAYFERRRLAAPVPEDDDLLPIPEER